MSEEEIIRVDGDPEDLDRRVSVTYDVDGLLVNGFLRTKTPIEDVVEEIRVMLGQVQHEPKGK